MILHRLPPCRQRLLALVGVPRSNFSARLSAATSCAHRDNGRPELFGGTRPRWSLPSSSNAARQYSPTPAANNFGKSGRGVADGKDGANERGPRPAELEYTRVGGPIDRTACELSETEINNLVSARARCKRARDFRRADRIREELQRNGVFVDDRSKEWRADGKKVFGRISARVRTDGNASQRFPSISDTHRMPRMKDCQTMDEAILAVHNNLEKASHRDLSAFWAVVPRLLPRGGRQQTQQLVPQLTSIFNKTAEKIGDFGPRDLVSTASAWAKIVDILGKAKKKNRRGGPYHECLQSILADRRGTIFQFIASTAVPVISRFDARGLANLAYAYGLVEYAPKIDDGSTLFHHIAEAAIPRLGEFKPQELSNTVWAFGKVGVSHPDLFGKVGDHIIGREDLHDFAPQELSNTVWAFAKAGVMHPAFFEKMGDHIVARDDLKDFKPQELSNTLNAFAKADALHPALFEKVGDHIVGREDLHGFKPQELSNTVNAFAKAGVMHPALFGTMGDHIVAREDLTDFAPQALANTLNAFAKAGISHSPLFERIADNIIGREDLNDYISQDVANILNAFAKAGVSHRPLFEKIGDHIIAHEDLNDYNPQELANTVHAFATAGVSHPALFERIADHIIAREDLHDFNPQHLSNTVWAFAKAGVSHPPLFEKLAHHIISLENTNDFSEQVIANLAWAYRTAGVKNRRLFDKLLIAAVEKRDDFSERTIQNFLCWTEGDD